MLPNTDAITRYRFDPTDVAVRFTVLDTIGYAGGSDPKQALAKALKAVNQAQVVLVVLDAQMAARALITRSSKPGRNGSTPIPGAGRRRCSA